jgi:chorismate mutase/prephenate dehydratase
MGKKGAAPRGSTADGSPKAGTAKSSTAGIEAEIKRIDHELIRLLNRRADATIRWIRAQPEPYKAIFDPSHDDGLFKALETDNPGPLPQTTIRGVFRDLLSAARNAVKPRRVAYLGPAYSYSHLAALERFGTSTELIPVNTIAAVFEEVNRGTAEFGVVPIENSTDGRIVDTLDMFTRLPLKICAEIQLNVHHNLLARCPRSEIVEVYSKPQALSQCREWLSRQLPQARLVEVTSTSTAAQLARDKPGAAAVASRQAASMYDLQIVAPSIQDNQHNVTRFAVIGHEIGKPTGKDKTAILLQIPHRPGSLADALEAFKSNKVNLTWIESFPVKGPETGGYLFFLDFEGHSSETRIKRTIGDLSKKAVRIEELGSYPRSEPID